LETIERFGMSIKHENTLQQAGNIPEGGPTVQVSVIPETGVTAQTAKPPNEELPGFS
jgi:hypothetical protein